MRYLRFLINISVLVLFLFNTSAYSYKTREEQKKYLKKQILQSKNDIRYADALLSLNKKNQNLSLGKLRVINRKIQLRSRLINNLSSQIELYQQQIEEEEENVIQLETEIDILKTQYANSIRLSYEYCQKGKDMIHVFSSDNIEQAYRRLLYFQSYSSNRRENAKSLIKKSHLLKRKIESIEQQKQESLAMLDDKNEEKFLLEREQSSKKKYIRKLSSKRKSLEKEIRYKQRRLTKLNKEIEKIIQQEIAAERARRARLAKKQTKQSKQQQKDFIKLSNSFGENRGKLPRPVNGVITSKFGKHRHPVIKTILIENSGIDIKTKPNTKVISCFKGEVKKIFAVPGKNKAIIIRHGEYLTVYSNLKGLIVKVGDKVKSGQKIGQVVANNGVASLHFEIWKEMKKLNPENWINF
jgi:septal ring factor EnvC (AmiA/AmiB activator)